MAFTFLQPGQSADRKKPWGAGFNPATSDEAGRRNAWATDVGFQVPTREAARISLQQSMSGQNPEDAAANDAIRAAFGERLQGLQGGMAQRKGQLESDLAQGFKNQVAELRRQAGGTGTMGSSTMGTQIGDLASQYQNNRAKAILDLEQQGLAELGQVQEGLGRSYGQDLQERGFQLNQGNQLSQLLMQQIAQDQARENGLAQQQMAQNAANSQLLGSIAGGLGSLGGAYMGYAGSSKLADAYSKGR